MDEFKTEFKYYKSRVPLPSFENVIKFEDSTREIVSITNSVGIDPWDISKYGFKPFNKWKVFQLKDKKGLLFIRNPFSSTGQRYWMKRCLKDFTKKPNKLNVELKDEQVWWEDYNSGLLKQLRWATLGYHHNWDTKVYDDLNVTPFPNDLAEMCKVIAKGVGYENYLPQASIINYYYMDSTLAPHTDHSEKYLEAPLISVSFGQTAIFLIGGRTKEEKPVAMFLQSGDIVIMSKESRLSYHAVPKIMKSNDSPWNADEIDSAVDGFEELHNEFEWKPYEDYISNARININVRQVFENK